MTDAFYIIEVIRAAIARAQPKICLDANIRLDAQTKENPDARTKTKKKERPPEAKSDGLGGSIDNATPGTRSPIAGGH